MISRAAVAAPLLLAALLLDAGPAAATGDAPRGSACAGVAGCQSKARVDVDGDGRLDDVGTVQRDRAGSTGIYHRGTTTVRVRTATGRTVIAAVPYDGWFGPTWHGATRLEGTPGAELVLGSTAGAHSQTFAALTWRGGRLVPLHAPGGGAIRDFYIDGALTIYAGVACGTDPAGRPTLTVYAASLEDGRRTYSTATTVSRYDRAAQRWVLVSSRSAERVPADDAAAPAGWRCRGLPRF